MKNLILILCILLVSPMFAYRPDAGDTKIDPEDRGPSQAEIRKAKKEAAAAAAAAAKAAHAKKVAAQEKVIKELKGYANHSLNTSYEKLSSNLNSFSSSVRSSVLSKIHIDQDFINAVDTARENFNEK